MANLNKVAKRGDWKAETSGAKIIFGHDVKRYKGEEYHALKGSIVDGNIVYIIELSCDATGQPLTYESKDGKRLVYGRLSKLRKTGGGK